MDNSVRREVAAHIETLTLLEVRIERIGKQAENASGESRQVMLRFGEEAWGVAEKLRRRIVALQGVVDWAAAKLHVRRYRFFESNMETNRRWDSRWSLFWDDLMASNEKDLILCNGVRKTHVKELDSLVQSMTSTIIFPLVSNS